MNMKPRPTEPSTGDLIDRIAKALPAEIRADYYREMMHCRSLPENDEMLRILRALQFLTLLMEQVPTRVVDERERLEQLFGSAARALEEAHQSNERHREQLDKRLIALPVTIAAGLQPETIAGKINESLQQQFIRSTIPQTAQALEVIAEQIKRASSEFTDAASTLGKSYSGAAADAQRAIDSLRMAVSGAASTAREVIKDLSVKFRKGYWTTLVGIGVVALLLGMVLGGVLERWIEPPENVVIERVITSPSQSELPVKPKRK